MRFSPLLVLVVSGCTGAAIRTIELGPRPGPQPADADSIQLYSAALPRCPFEDVAIVTSRPRDLGTTASALAALRTEARRLGGDAVVHVRLLEEVVLTGTVVRFTTSGCKD